MSTKKPRKRPPKKSKGLGDTIAKITHATGLDKLTTWIAGEDCGCEERQERLNRLFPYKTNCLTETEFKVLETFFLKEREVITNIQQRDLLKVYNRVFTRNKQITSCGQCFKSTLSELKDLYTEYKKSEIKE